MKFACTLRRTPDGQWLIRHASPEVGTVEVRGASREQAAEKLLGELRYRLELCPCTGESYQHIKIEVSAS